MEGALALPVHDGVRDGAGAAPGAGAGAGASSSSSVACSTIALVDTLCGVFGQHLQMVAAMGSAAAAPAPGAGTRGMWPEAPHMHAAPMGHHHGHMPHHAAAAQGAMMTQGPMAMAGMQVQQHAAAGPIPPQFPPHMPYPTHRQTHFGAPQGHWS